MPPLAMAAKKGGSVKKQKSKAPTKKAAKASPQKKKVQTKSTSASSRKVTKPAAQTPAVAFGTGYNPEIAFWPFYLAEHSHKANRALHFLGSTFAIICVVNAIARPEPLWLIGALAGGYGFAWVGHFFIEKNRPATFKYPLKSFLGDWRMYYLTLTGKLDAEYVKFGIETRG